MGKNKQKKAMQAKAKAALKKSARKMVKLSSAKKPKNGNGSNLPRMSSKPYGQDGKALEGVKILDFTHV